MNTLELIAAILGGGTLTALVQTWATSKKDKQEEIYRVLDEYKSMIDELRKVEASCKVLLNDHQVKIFEMQETITELKNKIILLETASNDLPFPMWLKDMDSRMLYLNTEYERNFLQPINKTAADYIGKFDRDIWPANLAQEYVENDKKTLKLKETTVLTEYVILNNEDHSQEWKVVKYLRYVGKTVIGIGGIAIPLTKTPRENGQ